MALLIGMVAFVAGLVALAGAVTWDLWRRGVAAWGLVGALTLVLPPIGLAGWAVLRLQPSRRSAASRA